MTCWSYRAGSSCAAEPVALGALALIGWNELDLAQQWTDWLAAVQAADGSVGIRAGHPRPRWPTSLALVAWRRWQQVSGSDRYDQPIRHAVRWALGWRGTTASRPETQAAGSGGPRRAHDPRQPDEPSPDTRGHDPGIVGWPWADGTHSWLEPTAMFVLALRALGLDQHPRTEEGQRLVLDRQLPQGGWNYGNTYVLGQRLVPHVQPTALALLALARSPVSQHVARSLAYLRRSAAGPVTIPSFCYAAMALSAYGDETDSLCSRLTDRFATQPAIAPGPYHLALLALALLEQRCPLILGAEN